MYKKKRIQIFKLTSLGIFDQSNFIMNMLKNSIANSYIIVVF